jgi:hypothetical protein
MAVFRRSSADAPESKAGPDAGQSQQDAPAKTIPAAQAGKGRPTPKRRDAERGRYRSIQGGTTAGRRRADPSAPARKLTPEEKARAKSERARNYEAMKRGEESALGPRDRGPVRRFARNYVDAHRRVCNYMIIIIVALVLVLPTLSRSRAAASASSYIEFGVIALVIGDAYLLGQKVRKLAQQRFPKESVRGVAMYAAMRGLQIRAMRFPKTGVKPGDEV